jgi:short subunit dehydrogenase-like uncharacterized protein
MPVPAREFDVVLWGATGFTGRLVADYFATAPSARGVRWAIAGRDRDKLARVRDGLGLPSLAIVVADAKDARSLEALAARTRVVCTTVGPYAQYGDELVAACVRAGTSSTDLTGETQWIRRTIDRHDEAARASGARIVHCCGFDSIPSDLGVFMLDEAMRARGRRLSRVDSFFGESRGGVSGGTIASMLNGLDEMKRDPSLRRMLADPYSLVPGTTGPDRRDFGGVAYEPRIGRWTGPFVMAAVNAPTVRRSNALLGYRYGRDFRYHERMSFVGGPKGAIAAAAVTAGLAGFVGAMQLGPIRKLVERRLPKPGEGPSAETRARGRFVVRYVADRRDPGYGSTAVMLAESSICLAKDDLEAPGGVLTPAAAMGAPLLARLRASGMEWEVGERLPA